MTAANFRAHDEAMAQWEAEARARYYAQRRYESARPAYASPDPMGDIFDAEYEIIEDRPQLVDKRDRQ